MHRSVDPEGADWGLTEHLLAGAVDTLRWLQWAKTKDAEKGRNQPPLIERPGVKNKQASTFGIKPMTIEQMNELMGWGFANGSIEAAVN